MVRKASLPDCESYSIYTVLSHARFWTGFHFSQAGRDSINFRYCVLEELLEAAAQVIQAGFAVGRAD